MTANDLIRHLPSILTDFPGIQLVYLFGSQVLGNTGPMSDYDLAILDVSDQDERSIQAQFQFAIAKLLDTGRVDVVLIDKAPIELAYHIITKGKLLYQSDLAARVELEACILGKYGDYLPVLSLFQQHILRGDPHAKRVQRYRAASRRIERAPGQVGSPPESATN